MSHDRERGGLYASERDGTVEGAAQADRGCASGVHADNPIGLRARSCGLLQALELLRRPQRRQRAPHRCARHRVQPQAFDGLLAFRLLVQIREDQLALATGVAGVDDLVDVLAAELLGNDRHLLARALVADLELEALGHDRQIGHPPALVLGVVRFRFGELDEVPDRPRDHVFGALKEALAFLERTGQHARQVLPHGGLLGDEERLGHGGQRSGRSDRRRFASAAREAGLTRWCTARCSPGRPRARAFRLRAAQSPPFRWRRRSRRVSGCRRSPRRPSSGPARRR